MNRDSGKLVRIKSLMCVKTSSKQRGDAKSLLADTLCLLNIIMGDLSIHGTVFVGNNTTSENLQLQSKRCTHLAAEWDKHLHQFAIVRKSAGQNTLN